MGPGQVVPSRNGSSTFIYYTYIIRIGIIPVPHVYKHQAGVLPTAKVAKSPSIQHLQSSHQTIVTFTEGSHFTSISYPGKPLAIQRFPFFEKKTGKQQENKTSCGVHGQNLANLLRQEFLIYISHPRIFLGASSLSDPATNHPIHQNLRWKW